MANASGQRPGVMVDTNVLVSGIINPYGLPRHLLDAWETERVQLLTSSELIAEAVRMPHPH